MSHFIRTCSSTSAIFMKYAPLYALSLGVPLNSDADYEALFLTIPDLPSFTSKGPIVKLMRWFAWYARFAWQESPDSLTNPRAEFWGAKIVYEHYLSADGAAVDHVDLSAVLRDVNMSPQEQLRQLKAASGGFKLAHKVMTEELYVNSKIRIPRRPARVDGSHVQSRKGLKLHCRDWRSLPGRRLATGQRSSPR